MGLVGGSIEISADFRSLALNHAAQVAHMRRLQVPGFYRENDLFGPAAARLVVEVQAVNALVRTFLPFQQTRPN